MPKKSKTITEVLRSAIERSEKTVYQIAKESGVTQITIWRFVREERDIRLGTVDRLANVLGLEMKETKKTRRPH